MEVCQAVVETLGRLEPATLAQHSAALVQMRNRANAGGRMNVTLVQKLRRLGGW
jgi:hypothetical protein